MPRRSKKKRPVVFHLSDGPLPRKNADEYRDLLLVFCDASKKRHGGLAAVFFHEAHPEPDIATCTVATAGSNELELQAVLFGLQLAEQRYPGKPLALFTDNQDAANRLNMKKALGAHHDLPLGLMLQERGIDHALDRSHIRWIKGHRTCRGNALADQYARQAAD